MHVERRLFSAAELGSENPLPLVGAPPETPYRITPPAPQEIIDGSRWGNPANLFPYQAQDAYSRIRTDRELLTVVLENDFLRAVFLPELGGRLWELFDKTANKHLLHTQRTIQFANLALRNAWFAGGVEWNIGTRGHSPTTCSPLHTGIVRTPDGHDVLRMWEFERLRGVVFQIDAWLPADSKVLLVQVRIRNPNPKEVPLYWWTNAAVPENPESRVIAPAGTAFASDYSNGISRVDPTDDDGIDCTWPTHNPRARDFFFDLAADQRRWILNADRDGDGVAMLSTERLRGRKLFVWGQGAGGTRWQEWLSPEAGPYAEIQAGLAQTQFQHEPMPSGAEWSWLEAYGNARLDPHLAHGTDWAAAIRHSESRVDELIDSTELASALTQARAFADLPPETILLVGTGWGALEAARRRANGWPWIDETGTPFSIESLSADQHPWLALLNGAEFTGAPSFVAGDDWEVLLERATPHPNATLHRAVMRHAVGETDAAAALYRETLRQATGQPLPRAHAHRGLALLALATATATATATEDGVADALAHYARACAALPASAPLLIEAATAAVRVGQPAAALRLIGRSHGGLERGGRVRFLTALALARSGHPAQAAAILKEGVEVADLREGENSITALWQEVCPQDEVPPQYQFSMH
ncbi:DUF5107 domain-containing protein [Glaciibacter psychrotolerans]|uniref:DUF5107 domain-containing protein n=1 Tax=Glaciibacter psychrotolerans TaxID=670054 RepID=A0A7Z0EEN0_9MICO|nr:DUF5107 domain-containing protein [Leifsonia psychrotolerans]NYJ20156.1 hypothetical protein [Leifsonia psychrotolerans]